MSMIMAVYRLTKNESGNETMLIFGNDCCDMWVWKIKHKVSPEAE